jgi:hypothetical protein
LSGKVPVLGLELLLQAVAAVRARRLTIASRFRMTMLLAMKLVGVAANILQSRASQ